MLNILNIVLLQLTYIHLQHDLTLDVVVIFVISFIFLITSIFLIMLYIMVKSVYAVILYQVVVTVIILSVSMHHTHLITVIHMYIFRSFVPLSLSCTMRKP